MVRKMNDIYKKIEIVGEEREDKELVKWLEKKTKKDKFYEAKVKLITSDNYTVVGSHVITSETYLDVLKLLELGKKYQELIENMLIDLDEYGIEPTTLTDYSGKEIVDKWRKKFKELENE